MTLFPICSFPVSEPSSSGESGEKDRLALECRSNDRLEQWSFLEYKDRCFFLPMECADQVQTADRLETWRRKMYQLNADYVVFTGGESHDAICGGKCPFGNTGVVACLDSKTLRCKQKQGLQKRQNGKKGTEKESNTPSSSKDLKVKIWSNGLSERKEKVKLLFGKVRHLVFCKLQIDWRLGELEWRFEYLEDTCEERENAHATESASLFLVPTIKNCFPLLATSKTKSQASDKKRGVLEVFNLLPNLIVPDLLKAFAVKTNDQMHVIYLSSLIRSVIALHNMIINQEHAKVEDEAGS
ncbi:hypothetical protein E3N88_08494 [Mikania micrantha]|uniref:EIF3F/CSN6-like C-terminal domain-containing protein n=1 Tax=Mikania micrantha TaxID=192012 RepID=A0A5N6PHD8_9ASTR|nr:hypothetical protein E3N88_08494 [Mikania micrantha]